MENIVKTIPVRCSKNARTISRFMPTISTIMPPMIIARGKPQNAVPVINPICLPLNWNCIMRSSIIPARIPNDKEVTSNAIQLAQNSLDLFIVKVVSEDIGKMCRQPGAIHYFNINPSAVISTPKHQRGIENFLHPSARIVKIYHSVSRQHYVRIHPGKFH